MRFCYIFLTNAQFCDSCCHAVLIPSAHWGLVNHLPGILFPVSPSALSPLNSCGMTECFHYLTGSLMRKSSQLPPQVECLISGNWPSYGVSAGTLHTCSLY